MTQNSWAMICIGLVLAMPVASAGNRNLLWVNVVNPSLAADAASNYSGDHVDVVNLGTQKIIHTITGIPNPSDRVFSPDGSRAYISSVTTEHNLYVVDTRTWKIINKVLLSGRPNRPTISKDGKRVYVAIRDPGPPVALADMPTKDLDFNFDNKYRWGKNGGAVDIVDTTSLKLIKAIPTTGPLHNCYVTPDGNYVACDSPEAHDVAVVDTRTEKLAWEAPVHGPASSSKIFRHGDPQSMSVEAGPDGSTNRITVEIRGLRGFVVVDFKTHKQVKIVQFPDEPSGFISNAGEPHTHGDEVSPGGKTRWVASQDANAYFIYSVPDDKALGHVSLPEFEPNAEFKAEGLHNRAIGCNTNELQFTKDGKQVWGECDPGFGITPFLFAVDVKSLKVLDDRIPLPDATRNGDVRPLSVIGTKK